MLKLKTHFLVAKDICDFVFGWLAIFVTSEGFTCTITYST